MNYLKNLKSNSKPFKQSVRNTLNHTYSRLLISNQLKKEGGKNLSSSDDSILSHF